jgi:hypothetical protein
VEFDEPFTHGVAPIDRSGNYGTVAALQAMIRIMA